MSTSNPACPMHGQAPCNCATDRVVGYVEYFTPPAVIVPDGPALDRTAEKSDPPTPRECAENFALCFQGWANSVALFWGGPIYLVGSMLTSPNPGDIDVRCLLTRERHELWFGADFESHDVTWSDAKFALHRSELKQSTRLTRAWRRGHVDFQFQTCLLGNDGLPILDDRRPRIRMDRVPAEMFAAGLGPP